MKPFLHLFLFLLAFQLEVRVRAADTALSEPENCFGRKTPCAFQISEDKWSFESGKIKLHSGAGTLLEQTHKDTDWKLVSGQLWVESGPSLKVQTLTATIDGSSGQFWVVTDQDKVWVRNISSKVVVTFKDRSKMELPRGFQVWVGAVNSEARVEHGMIEPVDLKEHLKQWYALYPGNKTQFLSEVQDLKDQWIDLVEKSGDLYKAVIERKMASLDEKKRQQQEAEKKKVQERQHLRQEFEKRVFEN